MNNKCVKCGLVNKQEALNCLRCGLALSASRTTGLNPFENEPKKSFSGIRLAIMLCVAVVGCFMAYQFFKVEVPKQKQQQITQKDVEKQVVEMMAQQPNPVSSPLSGMESASEAYRRDRAQREVMKQNFNYGQQYQHQPYIPPGSFGPPGAGVPYHTR